jgi:hypothetical protein
LRRINRSENYSHEQNLDLSGSAIVEHHRQTPQRSQCHQ